MLVPLLSGAGTKLKVLDGLASGRPVVSTSVGVEGIAAEDGRHLLVADGAEAFADAVVEVLADAALRSRLGTAGARWPSSAMTGACCPRASRRSWSRCL